MPKLLCRGINESLVREVSKNLTKDLSILLEIPTDRFTFAIPVSNEILIKEGKDVEQAPHIKVTWFERSDELMISAAALIRRNFLEAGIQDVGVYYENLYKKYSK